MWWVMQDRDFRRDLPRGVKNEGLHTESHGKNLLSTRFFEDIIGVNRAKRSKKSDLPRTKTCERV